MAKEESKNKSLRDFIMKTQRDCLVSMMYELCLKSAADEKLRLAVRGFFDKTLVSEIDLRPFQLMGTLFNEKTFRPVTGSRKQFIFSCCLILSNSFLISLSKDLANMVLCLT